MRISRAIADLFRDRIVPGIRRAGEAAELDAGVVRGIGTEARTAAHSAETADGAGARQIPANRIDPIGGSLREPGAPAPQRNIPRQPAEDGTPSEVIENRSAELGLNTPSQRAMESSLFIDEPVHRAALISDYPRPELMFGEKAWAGYLDARVFSRRNSDRELSVPFITELHQRVARFDGPGGGVIDGRERWFICGKPATPEEIANVEANPHLARIPDGTVPLKPNIGAVFYRLKDPVDIRNELDSLCDWYNQARGAPGTDPYRLAAELQQRFVSIHPYGDCNGRTSRLLMNWSLEHNGLSPSVLPDFNKDILSSTDQWTDAVRAGSQTFADRTDRLQQSGGTADPVQLFGLQDLQERYRNHDGETEPLGSVYHDVDWWRDFLEEL